jgi:signal transduction histidine kinase
MINEEVKLPDILNKIFINLGEGKMDIAVELLNKVEFIGQDDTVELVKTLKGFIGQYSESALFLNAIANGNLDVSPPKDPLHKNYVITQFKQLHSDLLHLTWQTKQIAKGDLKQKVSFLGEFSVGFNKMIEALREKELLEVKLKTQFAELQKVNSEKDKFFSIIAHDLRSPFNGFLGLTQLMAEQLPTMTMEDIHLIAVSMQNSATNLFRLLENLLEWSRMEQGMIPFKPEEIQLRESADKSIAIVLENAHAKDIEIEISIASGIVVYADSNILQTVIRNIVSNAVKFTPKGGKIKVSAVTNGENRVQVSITDSGIGMKPDMLANLFKLDVPTGRPGTEGEASTGLGLILCKEFVEKHGGKLWAESEVGKGSTFSFTVPQKPTQEI